MSFALFALGFAVNAVGMKISRQCVKFSFEGFEVGPWPAWFIEDREIVRHALGCRKAAEDCRTPRRFAMYAEQPKFRQVLECGSPLPLSLANMLYALKLSPQEQVVAALGFVTLKPPPSSASM